MSMKFGTGLIATALLLWAPASEAQGVFGHPLYGYAAIPLTDNVGQPLIDGETGQRITRAICLAWPSTGISGRFHEAMHNDWIIAVDYLIDVPRRTFTVTRVWTPNVTATPETIPLGARGWMLAGPNQISVPTNLVFGFYDRPQPGWDCNWQENFAHFQYHVIPGGGDGGGGAGAGQWQQCYGWSPGEHQFITSYCTSSRFR
jgi:hypothetical protein